MEASSAAGRRGGGAGLSPTEREDERAEADWTERPLLRGEEVLEASLTRLFRSEIRPERDMVQEKREWLDWFDLNLLCKDLLNDLKWIFRLFVYKETK
jgi:hypothetical protein